tara:strand:- start:1152 stop:2573 length:1422 start_codon:yes stop_codon:yes gene_type:complete
MGKASKRRAQARTPSPNARRTIGPRARLALKGGALLLLGVAAAWSTSRLLTRVDKTPAGSAPAAASRLAAVPEPPETVDALPGFGQAVSEADRLLRQAIRAEAPPETVGEMAGRLGNLYQANTYGALAEAGYTLASDLDPDNPQWAYLLAFRLQERGETTPVTPLLEHTVALDPGYAPAWLKLAENRFKQGAFEPARAAYDRRLALLPGDPWAALGLARLAIESGDWAEAESRLEGAIATAPEFAALHRLLAAVHAHAGHPEAEAEARRRANALGRFYAAPDPWVDSLIAQSFDVDWLLLNVSRYALLDADLSRTLFDRARALAPENPDVYVVLGEHVETLDEARRAFELALSFDPSHPTALARLGELLARQGDHARAVDLLERALEVGAETASVFQFLGLALSELGRLDDAMRALEEAVARAPHNADVHYSRAYLLQRAGRLDEAAAALRRVLELRPGDELASRALADLSGG